MKTFLLGLALCGASLTQAFVHEGRFTAPMDFLQRLVLEPETASASSGGSCVGCVALASVLMQRAIYLNYTQDVNCKLVPTIPKIDANGLTVTPQTVCVILNSIVENQILPEKYHMSPEKWCATQKVLGKGPFCAGEFTQCQLFSVWPPPSNYVPGKPVPTTPADTTLDVLGIADKMSELGLGIASLGSSLHPKKPTSVKPNPNGVYNIDPDYGNYTKESEVLSNLIKNDEKGAIAQLTAHLPVNITGFDGDIDAFSVWTELRGYDWRGADCNDNDATIYPGRSVSTHSADVDHDCNGISGSDSSGKSYEEELCDGTDPRGLIILGDSATAHFSLPQHYFRPELMKPNMESIWGIFGHIEDELDWPECSWGTGWQTPENCPAAGGGSVVSLRGYMEERNACNHRDFQNCGVNGARTSTIAEGGSVIESMRRNPKTDKPVTLLIAMIGNDVCNGHFPTIPRMTTPAEFYANVRSGLTILDATLPEGSDVVFVPLADGDKLFEILGDVVHPIRTSYSEFYDFLSCTRVTPCAGWMTTNATLRSLTQDRANALSDQYAKIISEEKADPTYSNFKVSMISQHWIAATLEKFASEGYNPVDFIEPSDGFHPSQAGNEGVAEFLWSELVNLGVVGGSNPNNAKIKELFGDQGGFEPPSTQ